ncbi:hypothetical protein [Gayadomonas joobiniege]|uniref:hypothetical protein n=1 Tax=Gayadomonas joobiniege TaxID=1234606 RepID=UPI00035F31B5|nr:hypothetical protein [Gayadomonas joobiniege]
MARIESLILVLIIAFVVFRLVGEVFDDTEASSVAQPTVTTQVTKNKVDGEKDAQSILWNELMSQKLPKVYSVQRLIHLAAENNQRAFHKYLDEWINNNPQQLYQRVFKSSENDISDYLKGQIIQRTVIIYPAKVTKILATIKTEKEAFVQAHLAAGYYISYPEVLPEFLEHTPAFTHIPGPAADLFVAEIYRLGQVEAASWIAETAPFSNVPKYQQKVN